MDYGQPTQFNGVREGQAVFDAGNNLDMSNPSINWGNSRNIGNAAMGNTTPDSAAEITGNYAEPEYERPEFVTPELPQYGQIIETEAPKVATEVSPNYSYDHNAIKIEGESISGKTVEIIDDFVKELGKDGDAASFLGSFEQAKIDNLKNSYNRTFGES